MDFIFKSHASSCLNSQNPMASVWESIGRGCMDVFLARTHSTRWQGNHGTQQGSQSYFLVSSMNLIESTCLIVFWSCKVYSFIGLSDHTIRCCLFQSLLSAWLRWLRWNSRYLYDTVSFRYNLGFGIRALGFPDCFYVKISYVNYVFQLSSRFSWSWCWPFFHFWADDAGVCYAEMHSRLLPIPSRLCCSSGVTFSFTGHGEVSATSDGVAWW